MTNMYVHTYAHTCVHCENRSLIQSLALMCSAINWLSAHVPNETITRFTRFTCILPSFNKYPQYFFVFDPHRNLVLSH